jgi:hypothetical protein
MFLVGLQKGVNCILARLVFNQQVKYEAQEFQLSVAQVPSQSPCKSPPPQFLSTTSMHKT